ncbi:hypothetical protein O6H91_03G123400 [Diphasiastrum complanatum]|uniref:Uncharacterized protein n=1 Tax=Diphasiastrum complanatum TaxID=34168 RepID=A0ACC2EBC4_DIPCM|nr:hypothetical protein O6H91_03G123400 [Diphasiastrum complanatum]
MPFSCSSCNITYSYSAHTSRFQNAPCVCVCVCVCVSLSLYIVSRSIGLFYLHEGWEKRIIHNDVKPSNVLLDVDFNPRLSDFGLARLIEDNNLAKTITLAGTLGFVAPELHKQSE